jgi:ATP-binding cassette subfamily B protein
VSDEGTSRQSLARLTTGYRRLSSVLDRSQHWAIAGIVAGSAGAGIAEAALLALVAQIATALSTGRARLSFALGPIAVVAQIGDLLWIAAALVLIRLILQSLLLRLPARLSGTVQSRLRSSVFDSFVASSWTAKTIEKEGHLQELMGGQISQAGVSVLQLGFALSSLMMFVALAASAFILSPGVATLVLALSIVLFAALRPISRRVRRSSGRTSAASMAQASGVAEAVRLGEEIEVFGVADAERGQIRSLVSNFETHFVRTRTLSAFVPVVYQTAVMLLLVAGLTVLYLVGTTRLATLGAVVLLLVRASSYGQQLQSAHQTFVESLPYLDRVLAAVERFRARAVRGGYLPLHRVGDIRFADVSYGYPEGRPVLRDVSFAISEGEVIGVVGPTGAGKSTLVRLMLQLIEPTHGTYDINGYPARDFRGGDWHSRVAYLPQEPHLLTGSVSDNIRFFRDGINDQSIERAAKLAHIHEDVASWRSGYVTLIGDRANAVSGGQRQRICLARALAGEPDLLVLDEPTSSLDPQSEALIQESMRQLRGKLTLIIVAHRLTTLDLCDRVMVIRGGHLEAFDGSHRLYASNDFYREAVNLSSVDGHTALHDPS